MAPLKNNKFRSMAFNANETYLLLKNQKDLNVAKLITHNQLQIIKQVPLKYWWFRINAGKNEPTILCSEDSPMNEVFSYTYAADSRASKLSLKTNTDNKSMNWNLFTSSSIVRNYLTIEKEIYAVADQKLINLDTNPEFRLPEEENATFYVAVENGVFIHTFGNKPKEWKPLLKTPLNMIKQMVYNPATQEIAIATTRMAYFIKPDGQFTTFTNEDGYWSVCIFKGRTFFYTWNEITEFDNNANMIVHDISGTVARNQCLFANDDTLYLVCEDEIFLFNDEKWTNIKANQFKID